MKNLIVIHCTGTQDDEILSMDEIMEIYSQDKNSDPLSFHYIVDQNGGITKGKKDKELKFRMCLIA